ncbi:MAG: AAA-like domain-containing protein [bacterium]
MADVENCFKYLGPLDPDRDKEVIICRTEDSEEILAGIKNSNYHAVIAPRQTGKTTIFLHLINEIRKSLLLYKPLYISFENMQNLDQAGFYRALVKKILVQLENSFVFDSKLIKEKGGNLNNNLDFVEYLFLLADTKFTLKTRKVEKVEASHIDFGRNDYNQKGHNFKFVIFFDEIDAIETNLIKDFILTIRSIFIERNIQPQFNSYIILMAGVADLADLTLGKNSPFNIARIIHLRDFFEEEVIKMVNEAFHYLGINYESSLPKLLFDNTKGHPYMTQVLCGRMVDDLIKFQKERLNKDDLYNKIDDLVINGDINLRSTLEKLNKDEDLKEVVVSIIQGEKISFNRSLQIVYQLELAGAIRNENGLCRIRNPICERFLSSVFNL